MIDSQINITSAQRSEFAAGARWIVREAGADPEQAGDVQRMFEALAVSLPRWPHPLLITELWQGFDLEALVVPPRGLARCTKRPACAIEGDISEEALRLVGTAIWKGMHESGADMLAHESDCGTKVFVFIASARQTVLQATGVDLLDEST